MGTYEYTYLAQAYGSGDYGDCSYTSTKACSTASASTKSTGGSGSLTNTGLAIAVIVTLACLLIFVAVLVRWWRRPQKAVAIASDANSTQDDRKL